MKYRSRSANAEKSIRLNGDGGEPSAWDSGPLVQVRNIAIDQISSHPEGLNAQELADLARHESAIERGLFTFREVGQALIAIQDGRLYRASHTSFQQYVKARFGIGRSHAHRCMAGADVLKALSPIGDTFPNIRESVLRPLVALDPDERLEVWTKALTATNGACPTAKAVREHVARFKERRADESGLSSLEALTAAREHKPRSPRNDVDASMKSAENSDLTGTDSEPPEHSRQYEPFVLGDQTIVPHHEWTSGLIPVERVREKLKDIARRTAATKDRTTTLATIVMAQRLTIGFAAAINRMFPPALSKGAVAQLPGQMDEFCKWLISSIENAGVALKDVVGSVSRA